MSIRPRTDDRQRRRSAPTLERLEARDLPTAPTFLVRPPDAARVAAADAAQPTPHELARRAFVAKFSGRFTTGPGRLTDQSSQTFINGGGTSSAFLHGDLQMAVYTPRDPSAGTTGTAALIVKNVSNSGNLLVLDLVGDATAVDPAGRPTRFTWTVNGGSGGAFSGAVGQGTVEIRYRPGGKVPRRATSAGGAGVIFQGSIDTNGVTNVLRPI
jgi:hypothetical protein